MFLDYFALGVLVAVFLILFYGVIIIHDIPYLLAKKTATSPSGCHSRGRLGQPVYPACYLATAVDLGDVISARAGMGHEREGRTP
jgi:hypothetical protein